MKLIINKKYYTKTKAMTITNLNQLDGYTLKVGDIIQFTPSIAYKIPNSLKGLEVLGSNDLYGWLGGEFKESKSYVTYYDTGDSSIDNNGMFGNGGGFPHHDGIIDLIALTRIVRTGFKLVTLKLEAPEVFNNLGYKLDRNDIKSLINRLDIEYANIKPTQVLTNSQISNEKVIVPKKNPTITRGKIPTGRSVQGKVRRVTIVSQHLSFTAGRGC